MRSKIILSILAVFLILCHIAKAQIGINQPNPAPSSVLHIDAADKGVIIPRLEDEEVISNPDTGLIIYNKTINALMVYNGTRWDPLYSYPKGGIIMWSGTIDNIPAGWALCDGSNGTPDLSGKFIVSYDSDNSEYNTVTNSGGSDSYNLSVSQLPSHNHSASSNSTGSHGHSITVGNDGSHEHTTQGAGGHRHGLDRLDDWGNTGDIGNILNTSGDANINETKYTASVGDHTHSISSSGGHNHNISINSNSDHSHIIAVENTGSGVSIDKRPSYFVLAFIMKM